MKSFIRDLDYKAMVEGKDSVLMFLILVFNLSESDYEIADIENNIDLILTTSGLPCKNKFGRRNS